MKQFHCKKCKRTWKTEEEDKTHIIYEDGICADCLQSKKLPDRVMKTTIKKGDPLPNHSELKIDSRRKD